MTYRRGERERQRGRHGRIQEICEEMRHSCRFGSSPLGGINCVGAPELREALRSHFWLKSRQLFPVLTLAAQAKRLRCKNYGQSSLLLPELETASEGKTLGVGMEHSSHF